MNLEELTGKPLDEVKEIIPHPYFLYISRMDGVVYFTTADVNPNRVHVEVNNNIVTYLGNG